MQMHSIDIDVFMNEELRMKAVVLVSVILTLFGNIRGRLISRKMIILCLILSAFRIFFHIYLISICSSFFHLSSKTKTLFQCSFYSKNTGNRDKILSTQNFALTLYSNFEHHCWWVWAALYPLRPSDSNLPTKHYQNSDMLAHCFNLNW